MESRQSSVNSRRASCPIFLLELTPFSPNRTPICEWLRLLPKALRPLPMVCVLFPGISKGYAAPRPYRGSGAALECGLGMNMLLWEVAGDESSRWCRMCALWCPLPKSPTHPAPLSPIPDPRSRPDPGSQILSCGAGFRRFSVSFFSSIFHTSLESV